MNSFINSYFGFSRQQRNGLAVLLCLCCLLLAARLAYPLFIEPAGISIQNLPLVEQKVDSAFRNNNTRHGANRYEQPAKQILFAFDPNTVSREQLQQLGFREKTAGTFLKFRSRGFVFKQKSDLKKVYGISDQLYSSLEPYIMIEKSVPASRVESHPDSQTAPAAKSKPALMVELNSADSAALEALSGIGPSYARRIIKYRSLLGGYVNKEQLKEVYGFTDELYNKVSSSVSVDAALVKKINLNTDDFKTINRHPYISYELTKSICDWRRKTDVNPTNLKDILNDPALYQKLLPYLAF